MNRWDCHGLPIELNAMKNYKKDKNIDIDEAQKHLETRKIAKSFALKYINLQMDSFKNLNLIADWSNIYRTIDANFMCNEIDVFYELYKKNLIFRDYMPVYWSIPSKTALAEFELEYNTEHKSNALYVAFEMKQYSESIKSLISEK